LIYLNFYFLPDKKMSIRCLVIGDPHIGISNLLDVDSFIEKSETAVRRLKPDFIVCLGDLGDRHETMHMDAYIRACTFLEKMSSYSPTFLTVGNHDRKNNSDFQSPDHFFVGMRHCPNLIIVDTTIKHEIVSKRDPNVKGNFLFVPYVAPGRFYEALDSIDLSELGDETWRSPSIDAIFAHQEFRNRPMETFGI
jgi:DNA repair exonuclease SbcCD nuclease subunit